MWNAKKPIIILATGGTGGHVFPAQAVAEEMIKRNWRVWLLVDRRGLKFTESMPDGVRIDTVPSASFSRGNIMDKITVLFNILFGTLISLIHMLRNRPAVVIGFGGYMAFPPLVAAILLRIPCMLHEQNSRLGLANKMLVRFVKLVACTWKQTNVKKNVQTVHTGNPVRHEFNELSKIGYCTPDGPGRNLLVIGGSQGAKLFDSLIPESLNLLPPRMRSSISLAQQVSTHKTEELKQFYNQLEIINDVRQFFSDTANRIAQSQLVIARAGASTLAELCLIGRPAILIPFARAANDHQSENARVLVAAGAAVSISESDCNPVTLATEIRRIFDDTDCAKRMANASKALGRPNSASELAAAAIMIAKKV